MSRLLIDVVCANEHMTEDVFVNDKDYPSCKECGAPTVRLWQASGSAHPIADDIPGGLWIRNGPVSPDGSPKKYYSHSAIAKAAKERGMQQFVRHVGKPGSDKSPFTQRWV